MRNALAAAANDAAEIGSLFARGQSQMANSLLAYIECGQRLALKKKQLVHGAWLPWLDANREALGFGESTACKLMRGAKRNPELTADLSEAKALELSRRIWGNEVTFLLPKAPPAEAETIADDEETEADESKWLQDSDDCPDDDEPERKAVSSRQLFEKLESALAKKRRHAADDDDESEHDSDETIWRRGLMHRANVAADHALFEDWSGFRVDDEILRTVEQAADNWAILQKYLAELYLRQKNEASECPVAAEEESIAPPDHDRFPEIPAELDRRRRA